MVLRDVFAFIQDLEEQIEEEVNTRQRLLLEKVTLETKVKSLETDLLTTVEQRDRLGRVSSTAALILSCSVQVDLCYKISLCFCLCRKRSNWRSA